MSDLLKFDLPWLFYLIFGLVLTSGTGFMVFVLLISNLFYAAFGFALLGVLLLIGFIIPASTKFTHNSIKQLTYRGWLESPWDEITEVRTSGYNYRLICKNGKFLVAPGIYSNANTVHELIEQKLSKAQWIQA